MRIRKLIISAAIALTAALGLAACGGGSGSPQTLGGSSQPSVAACTKAYPAWFAASAAAQKTTPTPAECKGLSQDQIAKIATDYLSKQGQ